jgi:hypothetical protein
MMLIGFAGLVAIGLAGTAPPRARNGLGLTLEAIPRKPTL